jgi:hypothetical protein
MRRNSEVASTSSSPAALEMLARSDAPPALAHDA